MIEIEDGFFLNPCHVTAIKSAGDDKCVLYVTGQSALEGFVVERKAFELAEEVEEALEDEKE